MNFKNLRTIIITAVATIATAVAVNSCVYDDTDLKNSINDLDDRIEALEDFQDKIQNEIEMLQDIVESLQNNVTVDDVVYNEDGSYTINFSDGTSVTIADGEDGKDGQDGQDGQDGMTPPTIIIREDGGEYYWGYEYPDGSLGYIYDEEGNRIPVHDDIPQVRIGENGNWEISTDGGVNWTDTGMPSSGGSGESIFAGVSEDEDFVYITLHDGTVISLPKSKEMSFDFGIKDETLYFEAGETKRLVCEVSGAEDMTVRKPQGWRAGFEGNNLVITAPAADNPYAETEGGIDVILVASNGQSLVSTLNVAIGSTPVVTEPAVGDYYYSDGTWSSELDGTKTVIGVVFYIGDPAQDDAIMAEDCPDCTHGLVISLYNQNTPWQSNYDAYGDNVDTWVQANLTGYESMIAGTQGTEPGSTMNDMLGYQFTKAIEAFNAAPEHADCPVDAVANLASFRESNPAPAGTSGWYMPSLKEASLILTGVYDGNIYDISGDKANKELLNTIFSTIEGADQLQTATFLSSSEASQYAPETVSAIHQIILTMSVYKTESNYYRYILAF